MQFAYFGDLTTGHMTDVRIRANWIWDLKKVRHFAEAKEGVRAFVCGGAMNQDQCADLMARRIMLCIDDVTMRSRLLSRKGNDFGKHPGELAEQLRLNRDSASRAQQADWVVVDASQPIEIVARRVIELSGVGA